MGEVRKVDVKRPVALITGVTGQDGTYLAEYLIARGYEVVGCTRHLAGAQEKLPPGLQDQIELVEYDITQRDSIQTVVRNYRPVEIYNFAGVSSGVGMFADPIMDAAVNGVAVTNILETIRSIDPSIHFCQASSREVFGIPSSCPQDEMTPRIPRSPYGASKIYADHMVRIYRQHYGLFACSAILFNHESPRRPLHFVSRKVTDAVAQIKLGLAEYLGVGDLDAQRDWGFAGDYVDAMWRMLQHSCPDDFVIATGVTHSVRELCDIAFGRVGLDYRLFIKQEDASFRPPEPVLLAGNPQKAGVVLGWHPKVGFKEMIQMMVDADMTRHQEKFDS